MSLLIGNVSRSLEILDEHVHSTQQVAPEVGPGVLVTAGAAPWALGVFSNDIIAIRGLIV